MENAAEVHDITGSGAPTGGHGCVVVHAGNRVLLVRGDLMLRADGRGDGQEERHRQEGEAPQVGRAVVVDRFDSFHVPDCSGATVASTPLVEGEPGRPVVGGSGAPDS